MPRSVPYCIAQRLWLASAGQRLRNVSLLPRWNNVSVKSTTAVSPHEPKSCEVRFWLVEFYVCYVCCMTQQKACTQSCQLVIFQLGASPPFSLLPSLSSFFPLSVPFHAADCGAASPDPSDGFVYWAGWKHNVFSASPRLHPDLTLCFQPKKGLCWVVTTALNLLYNSG